MENKPEGKRPIEEALSEIGSAFSLFSQVKSDASSAKQAAKNVIYTYCNTVTYNRNYDHSQDEIKAEVGTVSIEAPFAWWIPLLAGIDVLEIGGALVWAGLTLFLPSKKKEVENVGDSK